MNRQSRETGDQYDIDQFRLDKLALVISEADYLALPQGAPVELRIGERWVWNLGTLKKPAALD